MKKLSIICLLIVMCLTACDSPSKKEEPTLKETLKSADEFDASFDQIMQFSKIEAYTGLQGGWTDGKYFYQTTLKYNWDDENHNKVIIVKYDLEKKEEVQRSEVLNLNHANDITYNSKENLLIVVHNAPNNKMISFVDPETLTVKGTKKLNLGIYAIAYNEKTDCYAVGISGSYSWSVLNSDFEVLNTYEGSEKVEGFTKQGMACDENFVYFEYHGLSKIAVFDWNGEFVTLINMSALRGEPENISVVDGDIYLGTASGIFKVSELTAKK